jgi:hypothetical protein
MIVSDDICPISAFNEDVLTFTGNVLSFTGNVPGYSDNIPAFSENAVGFSRKIMTFCRAGSGLADPVFEKGNKSFGQQGFRSLIFPAKRTTR